MVFNLHPIYTPIARVISRIDFLTNDGSWALGEPILKRLYLEIAVSPFFYALNSKHK